MSNAKRPFSQLESLKAFEDHRGINAGHTVKIIRKKDRGENIEKE